MAETQHPEGKRSVFPEGMRKPEPAPVTGTATVNVACKIPNGLVLRVYEMQEDYEPIFGGGQRRVDKAFQVGDDVVLHGNALDTLLLRASKLPAHPHVGGYAITRGVSKDFWELWLTQNSDHPAVKNGLVFAYESLDRTSDAARERDSVESGFEGIDPANPAKKTGIRGITPGQRPT